ncbi:MAG: D-aminoacyl-tRNA deacylase [archaeon]
MKEVKYAIIVSSSDPAGMNIKQELEKLGQEVNIIDQVQIFAENLDKEIEADFFIFASKHQSADKRRTLTVHSIGNFHKADYGGKQETLVACSALFNKLMFQILNKKAKNLDYEVSLEVTHHGPFLEKPTVYIEIGSSEKEWNDKVAGKAIADTIIETIKNFKQDKKIIPAIAIGGKHYCSSFNKIQLNSNYALGHIIPQYSLPVNKELLKQAIEKTIEKPKIAILDWKGMKSAERQEIISLLNELPFEYIRTSNIEK